MPVTMFIDVGIPIGNVYVLHFHAELFAHKPGGALLERLAEPN